MSYRRRGKANTPLLYLRAQAIVRAKNPNANEEEQGLAEWARLATPTHLPESLTGAANTILERRWKGHNTPETLLLELLDVDEQAAKIGACHCVIEGIRIASRDRPIESPGPLIELVQEVEKSLRGMSGCGHTGAHETLRRIGNYEHGVLACVRLLDVHDIRLHISSAARHAWQDSRPPRSSPVPMQSLESVKWSLTNTVRRAVSMPPSSEWVRAGLEQIERTRHERAPARMAFV